MPVSPLDLQTLFTQMDKVGREQSLLKEGAAIQQSVQGAIAVKKGEEQARTVKSTETAEEDTREAKVDPELGGGGEHPGSQGKEGRPEDGDGGEGTGAEVIKDPGLGLRVDLSG